MVFIGLNSLISKKICGKQISNKINTQFKEICFLDIQNKCTICFFFDILCNKRGITKDILRYGNYVIDQKGIQTIK